MLFENSLRISLQIFESNHILSLHLIVTSRLGIHSSDTERITLVKLKHALSISFATTPIDQALLKLDEMQKKIDFI